MGSEPRSHMLRSAPPQHLPPGSADLSRHLDPHRPYFPSSSCTALGHAASGSSRQKKTATGAWCGNSLTSFFLKEQSIKAGMNSSPPESYALSNDFEIQPCHGLLGHQDPQPRKKPVIKRTEETSRLLCSLPLMPAYAWASEDNLGAGSRKVLGAKSRLHKWNIQILPISPSHGKIKGLKSCN